MKKLLLPMLLPAILTSLLLSCSPDGGENAFASGEKKGFEAKLAKMSTAEVDTLYAQICRRLDKGRSALNKEWQKATDDAAKTVVRDKARALLLTTLSDSIFVCWYGTGWDFNGTSTCPRQGNVACGYFVTTTLKQSAFNIERVHLAQQASSVLIHAFCPNEKIKTITNNQTKKLFDYMSGKSDGIYLLGLDNHTGFIVKKNGKTNFVHSSYLSSVDKVICEPLESSPIIKENNYFMVGDLSHSDETIEKWIKGEKIEN